MDVESTGVGVYNLIVEVRDYSQVPCTLSLIIDVLKFFFSLLISLLVMEETDHFTPHGTELKCTDLGQKKLRN